MSHTYSITIVPILLSLLLLKGGKPFYLILLVSMGQYPVQGTNRHNRERADTFLGAIYAFQSGAPTQDVQQDRLGSDALTN